MPSSKKTSTKPAHTRRKTRSQDSEVPHSSPLTIESTNNNSSTANPVTLVAERGSVLPRQTRGENIGAPLAQTSENIAIGMPFQSHTGSPSASIVQAPSRELESLESSVLRSVTPSVSRGPLSIPSSGPPNPGQTQPRESERPYPIYGNDLHGLFTVNTNWVEPFEGKKTEDAGEWLYTFEWIADNCQWSREIRIMQLRRFLKGTARNWFDCLPKEVKQNYERTMEEFKKAFTPESTHRFYQQLMELQQSEDEDVEDYLYQLLKLCQKANTQMTDLEKMHYFVRGLWRDLQDSVISRGAKNLTEAVEAAKKKQTALDTIRGWRDNEPERARKKPRREEMVVRAVNETRNYTSDWRKPGEFKRSEHNRSPRHTYRSSGYSGEDWRTMGGKPICRGCKRVGHIVRNCPEKPQQSNREEKPELEDRPLKNATPAPQSVKKETSSTEAKVNST